jgi:hypothetical protein
MSWVSEGFSSIYGFVSELLLDPKDLIVLGKSIGSAWSSTLDLSSSETAYEVSDEIIFGFSTSM